MDLLRRIILTSSLIAAIIFGLIIPASAYTWNVADDFAGSNPNGQWSYGFSTTLTGAITLYNQFMDNSGSGGMQRWDFGGTDPNVTHNPQTYTYNVGSAFWPAGSFSLHPGQSGQFSHARWVAPASGMFSLQATFTGFDTYPTTSDVHILVNGVQVFGDLINGYGPTYAKSYANASVSLGQGDTLDFVVGWGSNNDYAFDTTGLSAQITGVPLPGAALLLGSGLLGLMGWKIRRRSSSR